MLAVQYDQDEHSRHQPRRVDGVAIRGEDGKRGPAHCMFDVSAESGMGTVGWDVLRGPVVSVKVWMGENPLSN
ncbi:hypothetical protein BC938DRAFT_474950 [Jimgerdemannia flammicorona]|uniref:Uncharacterized protein n=1 Tax=Jimgerdemannia flammicorona TaxID=994334 RepID=A0A433Q181_9FUNG|nr:hypothetical protein BC938DRAFT_474950 [Jimgerdemannia flammicorona]